LKSVRSGVVALLVAAMLLAVGTAIVRADEDNTRGARVFLPMVVAENYVLSQLQQFVYDDGFTAEDVYVRYLEVQAMPEAARVQLGAQAVDAATAVVSGAAGDDLLESLTREQWMDLVLTLVVAETTEAESEATFADESPEVGASALQATYNGVCRREHRMFAVFGSYLGSYFQQFNFTRNATTVLSRSTIDWGQGSSFMNWQGRIAGPSYSTMGTTVSVFTQGRFRGLCVNTPVFKGCLNKTTPWIQQSVKPNGASAICTSRSGG